MTSIDTVVQQEGQARKAILDECLAASLPLHPFSPDVMKQHADAASLWFVIRGKVCDCTKWQAGHPGGAKPLLNSAGKDATGTFEMVHSPATVKSFTKFVVGALPVPNPEAFASCIEVSSAPASLDAVLSQERQGRQAVLDECLAALVPLHPFGPDVMKQHTTAASLWLIIRGKVCDCTSWQNGHPGGAKPLLNSAGKDATGTFEMVHSPGTVKGFTKYVVGALPVPEGNPFQSCIEGAAEGPAKSIPAPVPAPAAAASSNTELLVQDFKPIKVLSAVSLTSTTKMMTFAFEDKSHVLPIIPGGHISICVPKSHGGPCYRSYSPVVIKPGTFGFVVKKYEDGKGSGHLHSLTAGATADIRGPIPPVFMLSEALEKPIRNLVLVAGGTGAAPIVALAQEAAKPKHGITRVFIVMAFAKREDALLVSDAQEVVSKHPMNTTVDIVFSRLLSVNGDREHAGRISAEILSEIGCADGGADDVVAICGPPPFNAHCEKLFTSCGYSADAITVME
jgi:NAD(P)H-flavin reductase/cytochrome b involved in lipid metabolism